SGRDNADSDHEEHQPPPKRQGRPRRYAPLAGQPVPDGFAQSVNEQTPLLDVCRWMFLPRNLKVRSDATRRKYTFAIGNLSEMLGRPAVLADPTDDNVSMMMSLIEAKLTVVTANDRRKRNHTLWNWLAKRGLVKT